MEKLNTAIFIAKFGLFVYLLAYGILIAWGKCQPFDIKFLSGLACLAMGIYVLKSD